MTDNRSVWHSQCGWRGPISMLSLDSSLFSFRQWQQLTPDCTQDDRMVLIKKLCKNLPPECMMPPRAKTDCRGLILRGFFSLFLKNKWIQTQKSYPGLWGFGGNAITSNRPNWGYGVKIPLTTEWALSGGPFGGGDVGDKFYVRFFHLYPSNTNPTENCCMIEWKAWHICFRSLVRPSQKQMLFKKKIIQI